MTRKTISTSQASVACDVCGRTLLRGESSDVFLHGGTRRTVCELCTSRAVHEGWIREGLDSALGRSGREGAARGLLTRLRTRRDGPTPTGRRAGRLEADPLADPPEQRFAPAQLADDPVLPVEPVDDPLPVEPVDLSPVVVSQPVVREGGPAQPQDPDAPFAEAYHEPRGVHAVPTNAELKIARALEVFNASQHPRTVAGVARSLGVPIVSARPSATEGSIVTVVVGWELSWYRYEIDLGDEASGVRIIGQGAELAELTPDERAPNAAADDGGELHRVAGVA